MSGRVAALLAGFAFGAMGDVIAGLGGPSALPVLDVARSAAAGT
jgi:hypothetical protein